MIDTLSHQAGLARLQQSNPVPADLKAALQAAKAAPEGAEDPLRKVAEDFESMVLNTFFETMFQGIKTDGPFGGGQGEAMFRSMLNREYAKSIAAQGGIGLSDNVLAELHRMQEGA